MCLDIAMLQSKGTLEVLLIDWPILTPSKRHVFQRWIEVRVRVYHHHQNIHARFLLLTTSHSDSSSSEHEDDCIESPD